MDSPGSIEVKYIKNLQKQVFLLECETSYLREKARRVTSIQPKITKEASKLLQKMKEYYCNARSLATEGNFHLRVQNLYRGQDPYFEPPIDQCQLHSWAFTPYANAKEKLALMEDATKLKRLADISTQEVSNKEAELLKIQQEVQQTINAVKEKEHDVQIWESQLQQQIQQHQDMEQKLTKSRSEYIQLQALLHQLEEKFLTSSQSTQQQIAKELREEAEKLKQALKEMGLSTDEDKYLRNKMAEDCGHLTRENSLLQAQVLKATKQLNRERQLREEESSSYSREVSEMASGRERERKLEMELTYLKALLQDEKQKNCKAQDKVITYFYTLRYGFLQASKVALFLIFNF
nr:PREDICTED: dynactin subunit 1 [Anolis carolinensis]|eukprot:XP_016848324.1 PREDICTED: dynactin subunit 1 [Anolis carolinensis]